MLHPLWACLLLASAQASIAINVVIGKYLIDEEMPIFLIVGGRFLTSAICLGALMCCRPALLSTTHPTGRLNRIDGMFLLAQAFTGGFLFNYLFYWGMEYTTAISAGIISSSLPAILAILAYFFLKEKLYTRKIVALLLAMLGIMVISLDNAGPRGEAGSTLGDFLILLAMFPEALYSIFSKYSGHRLTSLGSATMINIMIFIMVLPFAWLATLEVYLSSFPMWMWGLVVIGGIASAMFYWAWPKGLLVIPASTAAVFTGVLPIMTALLGWYFLSEAFSVYDAIGTVLVLSSLLLGGVWWSVHEQ